MHTCVLILTACAVTAGPLEEDPITGKQFLRLMHGLHADYRDIAFMFEGNYLELTNAPVVGAVHERVASSYQGHFAYRSDGAVLVDTYLRSASRDDGSFQRETHVILDGEMTSQRRDPDAPYYHDPNVGPAGYNWLGQAYSPGRFFYLWYFATLPDPATLNYEFQGWEDVDGHRCLRVQMDQFPDSTSEPRDALRLWIDLERGGHPLKIEYARGDAILIRTDEIKLKKLPTDDGKELWMPISGRSVQLVNGQMEPIEQPRWLERTFLLEGSVRINSGLPDSVFSLDWNGGLPDSDELKKMREETLKPREPWRTDPVGVQERLDKMLAEADAQTERLVATSPARRSWRPTATAQLALAGVGAVLLAIALTWRLRTR